MSDRGAKLDRYRHFGVVEYWVVDPDTASIEVWALAAGREEPVVLGPTDTLRWQPSRAEFLEIRLTELFGNA